MEGSWTVSKTQKTRQKWSTEHIALLLDLYPTGDRAAIMAAVGRPWIQIIDKAYQLGVKRVVGKTPHWSAQHLTLLHQHYPEHGPAHVAALVGKPETAVLAYAKRLKLRYRYARRPGREAWSEEHLALVRQHYPTRMPLEELSALVGGRSAHNLQGRAALLGLRRLPRLAKEKPEPQPQPRPPVAAKPAPIDKATKKLVKAKAKAKASKKESDSQKPRKWFHFPMNSPQYQAGMAASIAGKRAITIIDPNGRPATVWRNA